MWIESSLGRYPRREIIAERGKSQKEKISVTTESKESPIYVIIACGYSISTSCFVWAFEILSSAFVVDAPM
jgi:hypothetical protein